MDGLTTTARLKIWILEIGEPSPLEPDVRLHRYGEFSRALAARGHDVTWWASSFSHAPRKFIVRSDQDVVLDGVTLRLIHGKGYLRSVSMARILHQRHFASQFLRRADSYPKPDIIICPIPTIENAEAAVTWGNRNGVPVFIDIRDLWPDELVDLAPSMLRWAARLLLSPFFVKMKFICTEASAITGVSRSYLDYGLKFAHRRISSDDFVFPLGYSAQAISPDKLEAARLWRDQILGRSDKFTLCFFGTLGNFFSIETVIEAARHLRREMPIQVIVGGDGSNLRRYRGIARGVDEIVFPGWLTAPRIAAVMESSHAGLAPYKEGARMSLPNKPFEYMSAGLPVISSVIGELADLLRDNDCGVTYSASSVAELCSVIRLLYRDQSKRVRMGRNALELFKSRYTVEKIFDQVAARIERTCAIQRFSPFARKP